MSEEERDPMEDLFDDGGGMDNEGLDLNQETEATQVLPQEMQEIEQEPQEIQQEPQEGIKLEMEEPDDLEDLFQPEAESTNINPLPTQALESTENDAFLDDLFEPAAEPTDNDAALPTQAVESTENDAFLDDLFQPAAEPTMDNDAANPNPNVDADEMEDVFDDVLAPKVESMDEDPFTDLLKEEELVSEAAETEQPQRRRLRKRGDQQEEGHAPAASPSNDDMLGVEAKDEFLEEGEEALFGKDEIDVFGKGDEEMEQADIMKMRAKDEGLDSDSMDDFIEADEEELERRRRLKEIRTQRKTIFKDSSVALSNEQIAEIEDAFGDLSVLQPSAVWKETEGPDAPMDTTTKAELDDLDDAVKLQVDEMEAEEESEEGVQHDPEEVEQQYKTSYDVALQQQELPERLVEKLMARFKDNIPEYTNREHDFEATWIMRQKQDGQPSLLEEFADHMKDVVHGAVKRILELVHFDYYEPLKIEKQLFWMFVPHIFNDTTYLQRILDLDQNQWPEIWRLYLQYEKHVCGVLNIPRPDEQANIAGMPQTAASGVNSPGGLMPQTPAMLGAAQTPAGLFGAAQTPAGLFGAAQTPAGLLGAAQTPAGLLGAAQTPAGLIGAAQTPAGLLGAAQTPAGLIPNSQTPAGLLPNSQTPAGLLANSQTPAGLMANSQTPAGLLNNSQTPAGGMMANAQTPAGLMANAQTPADVNMPNAQTPADVNIPNAQTPADLFANTPSPGGFPGAQSPGGLEVKMEDNLRIAQTPNDAFGDADMLTGAKTPTHEDIRVESGKLGSRRQLPAGIEDWTEFGVLFEYTDVKERLLDYINFLENWYPMENREIKEEEGGDVDAYAEHWKMMDFMGVWDPMRFKFDQGPRIFFQSPLKWGEDCHRDLEANPTIWSGDMQPNFLTDTARPVKDVDSTIDSTLQEIYRGLHGDDDESDHFRKARRALKKTHEFFTKIITTEPRIKRYARSFFREHCFFVVRPTARAIDNRLVCPTERPWMSCHMRAKPFFEDDGNLSHLCDILKALQDELVTVDFILLRQDGSDGSSRKVICKPQEGNFTDKIREELIKEARQFKGHKDLAKTKSIFARVSETMQLNYQHENRSTVLEAPHNEKRWEWDQGCFEDYLVEDPLAVRLRNHFLEPQECKEEANTDLDVFAQQKEKTATDFLYYRKECLAHICEKLYKDLWDETWAQMQSKAIDFASGLVADEFEKKLNQRSDNKLTEWGNEYFKDSGKVLAFVQTETPKGRPPSATTCFYAMLNESGFAQEIRSLEFSRSYPPGVRGNSASVTDLVEAKLFEEGWKDLKRILKTYQPIRIVIATQSVNMRTLRNNIQTVVAEVQKERFRANKNYCENTQVVLGDTIFCKYIAYHTHLSHSGAYKDIENPLKRMAISLARYHQNPTAEMLQLWHDDYRSNDLINVELHRFQTIVPKPKLVTSIRQKIMEAVFNAEIDINKFRGRPHIQSMLQFIPGLGPRKAKFLIDSLTGPVKSREQLALPFLPAGAPHEDSKVIDNCLNLIKVDNPRRPLEATRILHNCEELDVVLHGLVADAYESHTGKELVPQDGEDEIECVQRMLMQLMKSNVLSSETSLEFEIEPGGIAFPVWSDRSDRNDGKESLQRYFDDIVWQELEAPFQEKRSEFHKMTALEQFSALGKSIKKSDVVIGKVEKRDWFDKKSQWKLKIRIPHLAMPGVMFVNDGEKAAELFTEDVNVILAVEDVKWKEEGNPLITLTYKWDFLEQKDWDFIPIAPRPKLGRIDAAMQKFQTLDFKRNIRHTNYRQCDFASLIDELDTLPKGESLFRHSKNADILQCVLKIEDKQRNSLEPWYRLIDFKEEERPNVLSLGKKLTTYIGKEEYVYSDLDEILALHLEQLMNKSLELESHTAYAFGTGLDPNITKIPSSIKEGETADLIKFFEKKFMENQKVNDKKIYTKLVRSTDYPGNYVLMWMYIYRQIFYEYIEVHPSTFRILGQEFETVEHMVQWFKRNGWRDYTRRREDWEIEFQEGLQVENGWKTKYEKKKDNEGFIVHALENDGETLHEPITPNVTHLGVASPGYMNQDTPNSPSGYAAGPHTPGGAQTQSAPQTPGGGGMAAGPRTPGGATYSGDMAAPRTPGGANLGGNMAAPRTPGGANLGGDMAAPRTPGGANYGGDMAAPRTPGGANYGGDNMAAPRTPGGANYGGNMAAPRTPGGANYGGDNMAAPRTPGGANYGGDMAAPRTPGGANFGGDMAAPRTPGGANYGDENMAAPRTPGAQMHSRFAPSSPPPKSGDNMPAPRTPGAQMHSRFAPSSPTSPSGENMAAPRTPGAQMQGGMPPLPSGDNMAAPRTPGAQMQGGMMPPSSPAPPSRDNMPAPVTPGAQMPGGMMPPPPLPPIFGQDMQGAPRTPGGMLLPPVPPPPFGAPLPPFTPGAPMMAPPPYMPSPFTPGAQMGMPTMPPQSPGIHMPSPFTPGAQMVSPSQMASPYPYGTETTPAPRTPGGGAPMSNPFNNNNNAYGGMYGDTAPAPFTPGTSSSTTGQYAPNNRQHNANAHPSQEDNGTGSNVYGYPQYGSTEYAPSSTEFAPAPMTPSLQQQTGQRGGSAHASASVNYAASGNKYLDPYPSSEQLYAPPSQSYDYDAANPRTPGMDRGTGSMNYKSQQSLSGHYKNEFSDEESAAPAPRTPGTGTGKNGNRGFESGDPHKPRKRARWT